MKHTVYIGCLKGSGRVQTEDGLIVKAPPIFMRFRGEPLIALKRWAQGQGGYSMAKVPRVLCDDDE